MNLNYTELKESGVALVINDLRKHMSTKIAEVAKRVRNEWKVKLAPRPAEENPGTKSQGNSYFIEVRWHQ